MNQENLQNLIEDATFDFTIGNNQEALEKLNSATLLDSQSFQAWHALAEVYFSMRNFDKALSAAEKAYSTNPQDIHINTSLSRIWMEKGNKQKAELFGSQARMLGWKAELAQPNAPHLNSSQSQD